MKFKFTVEAEVERIQGKFRSRDEISEQILEWLERADEQQIDVEESQYETTDWTVTEEKA